MAVSSWLNDNWFSLVQTASIVGGLFFTAASIRGHVKERQISNIISLCDRHREIWTEAIQRPELKRVFLATADLSTSLSLAEEEFLNLVIIHYELGWRLAKRIGSDEVDAQKRDARGFFALPLPRAVWEKSKEFRNQRFVRFVEKALLAI